MTTDELIATSKELARISRELCEKSRGNRKSMKFTVTIPARFLFTVKVEADTEEEAVEKAWDMAEGGPCSEVFDTLLEDGVEVNRG